MSLPLLPQLNPIYAAGGKSLTPRYVIVVDLLGSKTSVLSQDNRLGHCWVAGVKDTNVNVHVKTDKWQSIWRGPSASILGLNFKQCITRDKHLTRSLIQYSTVQYSTYSAELETTTWLSHSTALFSTAQYSTVQYSTVHYITVQYSTVQYSTVQYSTSQYSTVPYTYSTVHLQYSTVHTVHNSRQPLDSVIPQHCNYSNTALSPPTVSVV